MLEKKNVFCNWKGFDRAFWFNGSHTDYLCKVLFKKNVFMFEQHILKKDVK